MPVSTAVVLAAGQGTRLAGAGVAIPKGLIDVGGEALVGRSLRLLMSRGITDAVLITGHQAELYDRFAAERSGVRCIYNRNFDVLGSLESLRCALGEVTAPFLLLDADIIYESRGLDVILEQSSTNAVIVSDLTGSGDEFYAWANSAGRITHLSKLLSARAEAPSGEHIGILKIGETMRRELLARAPARLLEKPMDPYESLVVDLLPEHPMQSAHVPDLLWSEIDDAKMLDTARNVTWPGLLALGDI